MAIDWKPPWGIAVSLPYKQRAFIIYDNDVTLKIYPPFHIQIHHKKPPTVSQFNDYIYSQIFIPTLAIAYNYIYMIWFSFNVKWLRRIKEYYKDLKNAKIHKNYMI